MLKPPSASGASAAASPQAVAGQGRLRQQVIDKANVNLAGQGQLGVGALPGDVGREKALPLGSLLTGAVPARAT